MTRPPAPPCDLRSLGRLRLLLLCGVFWTGAADAQTSLVYSADSLVAPDGRVSVLNPTPDAIRIDSLGLAHGDSYGGWRLVVETAEGSRDAFVANFFEEDQYEAIGLAIRPGESGSIEVGRFDPCPACRVPVDSLDALLVFAGGSSIPDTLVLDTAGIVGVDDAPRGHSLALAVAPNPTRGSVTVTAGGRSAEPVRIVVYDALGREVAQLHEGSLVEATRFDLRTATLPSGIYLVRATTAGGARSTATVTVAR